MGTLKAPIVIVVVVIVIVAIVVAFDVGINKVTTTFGFEGFKKFLGDASR